MSELEKAYRQRFDRVLLPLAAAIESHVRENLKTEPRIDRITGRAKSIDRFLIKAIKDEDGQQKYSDPLRQIQDQVGVRIVTFYLSDVERVAQIIEKYYRAIETKNLIPESEWQFGYFGRHYVLLFPTELVDSSIPKELMPNFFELQIKTLFQHAWAEANHDLGYKRGIASLNPDSIRSLAFTSAQAWGADRIFEELSREHIK